MMIQRSDVEHVARLARLQLQEEEIQTFTQQLGQILDYVHRLEAIDTEEVEPTAHALSLQNVFREDEVEPSLNRDEVLKGAPEREGVFFKTPKILP